MKIILVLIILLMGVSTYSSDDLTIVAIGDASVEKEAIHINLKKDGNFNKTVTNMIQELFDLFISDFSYYKSKFSVSKSIGTSNKGKYNYLINLVVSQSKHGYSMVNVNIEVKRLSNNDTILNSLKNISLYNLRDNGHSLTDQIYQKITGQKSIFKSFIIFVSDIASSKGNLVKELYRMDFDGKRKKRLTFHKGTVISPAISRDNKQVLYSMVKNKITKKRRVNLYIMNLKTKKFRLLSSRKGINSGAVFMPDGKHIALTLTHTGNAEIYALNLRNGGLRRITKHYSIDVDPAISIDGKLMVFLSSRPGEAHIYTMDPRGVEKNVIRVSYVGKYNATPRFSPDGKQIAFSSWLDNRFDIFRIDSNRKNLVRLTKNFGSNESPTWSRDGHFIAFSSQRVISRSKAVHNIYIMTQDGDIIKSITDGHGMCISPRWSK